MTVKKRPRKLTWYVKKPQYTGKKRSGPKSGSYVNVISEEYEHLMWETRHDRVIDGIRTRMNEPDAILDLEISKLDCALESKSEFKDEIDDDRKELKSLKKKIKKMDTEFRKQAAKLKCHSKLQMGPFLYLSFERYEHFPRVCRVIHDACTKPRKMNPTTVIAHIEKLLRTADTVSDLQPALKLANAALNALDEIEKQKEAEFKRDEVEIKKLRVQLLKKIDEKAASKAAEAEVPNEEGTCEAAEFSNEEGMYEAAEFPNEEGTSKAAEVPNEQEEDEAELCYVLSSSCEC